MKRPVKKRASKIGVPPGTLIYTGKIKTEKVTVSVIDYNEGALNEREISNIDELINFKDSNTVSWINITGLNDVNVIEKVGTIFDIHPLTLEDILHVNQRPKAEEYDNYIFLIVKMLTLSDDGLTISSEQISIILGKQFVITFQEKPGDVFEPIRNRLRSAKGRIRKMKADYLVYSLADTIVDNYFLILEKIGDTIEQLEEELLENPDKSTLHKIHSLKTQLIELRKSVWPLREVINNIERSELSFTSKPVKVFLRDLYDHTIQVIDGVETFRDIVTGMMDIYLSSVSNKMNEVMKLLTIIATIFIPLTFIAGVYGMNFKFMPELEWKWGYPAVLIVMILIGIGMLIYFKKKKWI